MHYLGNSKDAAPFKLPWKLSIFSWTPSLKLIFGRHCFLSLRHVIIKIWGTAGRSTTNDCGKIHLWYIAGRSQIKWTHDFQIKSFFQYHMRYSRMMVQSNRERWNRSGSHLPPFEDLENAKGVIACKGSIKFATVICRNDAPEKSPNFGLWRPISVLGVGHDIPTSQGAHKGSCPRYAGGRHQGQRCGGALHRVRNAVRHCVKTPEPGGALKHLEVGRNNGNNHPNPFKIDDQLLLESSDVFMYVCMLENEN